MSDVAQHPAGPEPTASDIRLVIAASSAGTIFEWYDFFIYGTLATLIGKAFFPAGNETLQTLLVWAGFAVGFGFRPLGAILFGFLGDKLGRKYTFLVTVTLISDALNRSVKLRVSANALRTVEHRGGLDAFLLKADDGDLSKGALALKKEVRAALAA